MEYEVICAPRLSSFCVTVILTSEIVSSDCSMNLVKTHTAGEILPSGSRVVATSKF